MRGQEREEEEGGGGEEKMDERPYATSNGGVPGVGHRVTPFSHPQLNSFKNKY